MPRNIGDRNPDVGQAVRRLQDALVCDERDTSRQSMVIIIPEFPDDDVQVFENGVSIQLDGSLTVEQVFELAIQGRSQHR